MRDRVRSGVLEQRNGHQPPADLNGVESRGPARAHVIRGVTNHDSSVLWGAKELECRDDRLWVGLRTMPLAGRDDRVGKTPDPELVLDELYRLADVRRDDCDRMPRVGALQEDWHSRVRVGHGGEHRNEFINECLGQLVGTTRAEPLHAGGDASADLSDQSVEVERVPHHSTRRGQARVTNGGSRVVDRAVEIEDQRGAVSQPRKRLDHLAPIWVARWRAPIGRGEKGRPNRIW